MTAATKPGDPADKAADGAFGGQPTTGSHRAGYGDKFRRVEDWVRRYPTSTLASGEGWVLLQEIDRLREQLYLANESAASSSAHAATLRAAIERARALHISFPGQSIGRGRCMADGLKHPCPTIRALDGGDA